MPCMDLREGKNCTGLATAVGTSRISTFQNAVTSGIPYPTRAWSLVAELIEEVTLVD